MHNEPRTEARSDQQTELYADILARIEHGIFAVDAEGSYTYMNAVAGQMLGLDPQWVVGRSIWADFPDNPENSLRNACKRANTRQEYECLEAYWLSEDRWLEYNIHPSATALKFGEAADWDKLQ